MRPVDGEFVHSAEKRVALCAALGHPANYINLSVSGKVGREVRRCHCGIVDETREALRTWKRARAERRQSVPAQDSSGVVKSAEPQEKE